MEGMTKDEIIDLLKWDGFTRKGNNWDTYERAKKVILRDMPDQEEYANRIKIISNYLRI